MEELLDKQSREMQDMGESAVEAARARGRWLRAEV